jgi:hypothetical protein
MVITEKFVFIHMPKTGGTFVTSILDRLHTPVPQPWVVRKTRRAFARVLGRSPTPVQSRYGKIVNLEPKHGTCHDIPSEHRKKPILSCVRNPYDWYVSQFEFSWWKRTFMYDPSDQPTPAGYAIERVLPEFQRKHPHFPAISFAEFIELCDSARLVYDPDKRIGAGLYTHGFARYFLKQPERNVYKFSTPNFGWRRLENDTYDVTFINTERLNNDLPSFLATVGYRAPDLAFIYKAGKILPEAGGRRDDQKWEGYYTPDLKQKIRVQDSGLFALFPEFDV